MLTTYEKKPSIFLLHRLFIILFIPVISLSACKVQLVPAYNAELEEQIVKTAKMSDMLYLEMMDAASDKKSYSLYADKYLDIESEINSILLKNEVRSNAADNIATVQKLKDYFVKAKEDHKTRTTMSNAEMLLYNEQLKAFWKPVLIAERALK